MWKTQSPWPALRGFLYDHYLEPTGGHRGAAAANRPRAVQADMASREILLVNAPHRSWAVETVEWTWLRLDGSVVDAGTARVDMTIQPTAARGTGVVAAFPKACAGTTCFLARKAARNPTVAFRGTPSNSSKFSFRSSHRTRSPNVSWDRPV